MKIQVFNSIRDVPKEQWNRLLNGRSCAFSHEFWEVIEESRLNDFSYRYVLFLDEADQPVALTSYYSITTDIAIFAPAGLRNLLAKVRRIFPNFFKLRMLECGTPITVSSPPIVAGAGVAWTEIIAALDNLLQKKARAGGHHLIIIRDFEPNAEALQPDLNRLGYHCVDSLPNTYLDIKWSSPEQYVAALTSYYRSKLLKHLRKNAEHKVRHELVDDFHDLAETLCAQWMVVHNQADEFQREVLTPTFYREFSAKMGARSKALLFYRGDELVGHALLLLDGDTLRWLYFGRNEARNDSLYLYVGYAVIETAIKLGAKRLEMGLTTYSIKLDLGARMSSIRLALRSPLGFINPLVGRIYPLLNSTPSVENKRVFKLEGG